MNTEIKADEALIAYCGLYCGACPKYLKGKCPGCHKYEKATWCKIRTCCIEKGIPSCARCSMNVHDCKKFNNFMGKLFGFIFRTDRGACIARIKEKGEEDFAREMASKEIMSFKK